MPTVLSALLYAVAPTLAIPAGAAAVARLAPGPSFRSLLQHFAAGGLLAIIGVELLGELDSDAPLAVALGITLGALFMTALDYVARAFEHRGGQYASVGLLSVVAIDFAIDGALLGIALTQDHRLGLLLAVALTLEDLVVGLSVASAVIDDLGRGRLVPVMSLVSLAFPVGAMLGALVGDAVEGNVETVVFAFAAVALLFLVVEELLREAHEVKETAGTTMVLFAGLLAFLLLESAL